jgi:transketolase
LRDFGASAPITDLLNEFGLTVECVVEEAKRVMRGSEGSWTVGQ